MTKSQMKARKGRSTIKSQSKPKAGKGIQVSSPKINKGNLLESLGQKSKMTPAIKKKAAKKIPQLQSLKSLTGKSPSSNPSGIHQSQQNVQRWLFDNLDLRKAITNWKDLSAFKGQGTSSPSRQNSISNEKVRDNNPRSENDFSPTAEKGDDSAHLQDVRDLLLDLQKKISDLSS